MLTNLKLTLTTDRKLVSVECDDFRVKLNGNTNDAYKRLLKEFGIEVVYQHDEQPPLNKMQQETKAHDEKYGLEYHGVRDIGDI